MRSEVALIMEHAFAAIHATLPVEYWRNCSRGNPSRSCGALVTESDEAVPGEVQTRSRTRVAGVIRAQVLVQSVATHERASAASLRSWAGGAWAVLGSERTVVWDGEVGSALLMRSKAEMIVEHACASIHATLPVRILGQLALLKP